VATAIVDGLEPVQVEVEQGQSIARLHRVLQRLLQCALQATTVGKACQRVVAGSVLEFALCAAQFGHLMGHPDPHTVFGQPLGRPLDVHAVPVLVDVAIAEVALQHAVHHVFGLLQGRRAVVGVDQVERSPAKHLVGGIPEDALETRTDIHEATLCIDDADRVGQQVQHIGEGRQLRDHRFAACPAAGHMDAIIQHNAGETRSREPRVMPSGSRRAPVPAAAR
jgi:hypothetical protein